MNHIHRFLVPSKRDKDMDRKNKPWKSKLERRNADKHIEYDATSFSSCLDDSSESLYTRSLDIPDRTSFRIEGTEGEVDRICQRLGLSGPEDFSIPTASWEAMKLRSSSDILPVTKALDEIDVLKRAEAKMKRMSYPVVEVIDGFEERVSIRDSNEPAQNSGCRVANSGVCVASVEVGIKGIRPPFLKPPPSMRLPVIDKASSTWDLVKDLAPQVETRSLEDKYEKTGSRGGKENRHKVEQAVVVVREVDGATLLKREEDDSKGRMEGNAVLSESYSFTTTSNDDDSSSTTTEPFSTISPNGRIRRVITDWQKGDLLGRGSFGSVYEGISDDGFFFAVKEVSLLDQGSQGRQSISQLEHEIALLSHFEHENIVQYYGTDKDESTLYIFLELITKGSLANLYRTYRLRDSQVSFYTRQILRGLKYLHDQDVVHRDIKCANILVDANGSVKLADFGLAKATKLNDVKSCKGTAFWMAPEVVKGKHPGYGLPADIWSLGCTVLEMLTGQIPYARLELMQALYRIGKGKPPEIPDSLSRDARDFIMQCLQINPDDRPAASDLLNHSFVKRALPPASGSESPYN